MPQPGAIVGERVRLIAHQAGFRRLATCPNTVPTPPPQPFIGEIVDAYSGSLQLDFSGMPIVVAASLADGYGVLPEMLADPNASGSVPISGGIGPSQWRGFIGSTVNSAGCFVGMSGGVYARVRRLPVSGFFILESYVLTKLQDGSCEYLMCFKSGMDGLHLVIGGTPQTVSNRAYVGGEVAGVFASAAGTCAVSLPS